jgi:hypothetical protein
MQAISYLRYTPGATDATAVQCRAAAAAALSVIRCCCHIGSTADAVQPSALAHCSTSPLHTSYAPWKYSTAGHCALCCLSHCAAAKFPSQPAFCSMSVSSCASPSRPCSSKYCSRLRSFSQPTTALKPTSRTSPMGQPLSSSQRSSASWFLRAASMQAYSVQSHCAVSRSHLHSCRLSS